MRVDRSKVTVAGFGQRLELQAPDWPFLRTDTQWRLRRVYEPALAAALLPPEGMAVDIGAGFGGFALPFARAFPGWMVWCFEPEPEAHAALVANIAALGLGNVIALPVAVAGLEGAPADLGALAGGLAELAGAHLAGGAAGGGADPAALVAACPRRVFRRSREKRGVLEAAPPGPGFEAVELPVLPALALGALAPDLVKLMAPFAEIPILEELAEVPLGLLLGESWTQVPSALMHGQAPGPRQCWLPLAGRPGLALRRQASGGRPGLDVVVAMHDSAEWIADCVEGILASPSEEVRAVVVDDGSTDGSAELVQALWGSEPRVRLVSKPNGGCASARNYGRLMSDASHIAFVDADDAPGASLFSELLELARYTGAEVVQGGFELIHMEAGGLRIEPSYEAGDPGLLALPTEPFGAGVLRRVPAGLLITGQPTIWRRVYRRDFLDRRGIWFPEHIRAFDDQIFQLVTLQLAGEVPSVDHVLYGYRQHAGQDIRQGDARAFASLGMYRLVLRRALAEGWNDLRPLLASYVNTVNWSCGQLERGLRPRFVRAAAELWVVMRLALGEAAFAGLPETAVQVPDFAHYVQVLQGRLAGLPASHAWACLDSIEMHAPLVGAPMVGAPVVGAGG